MEEYDPQKRWKFKKFLRGRFKNGRREIYVEWEPDSCFDDDVLEMINRKFTKLGTIKNLLKEKLLSLDQKHKLVQVMKLS